ncbi:hypothetical protein [Streptomyces sp. NPDC001020]
MGGLAGVGYKHGRWIDTVMMQRSLGHEEIGPIRLCSPRSSPGQAPAAELGAV